MKRTTLFTVTIALVCLAIVAMPHAAFARGGRQGVPVIVKNFPATVTVDNIPESIAVNNFPATVTVDNFPTSVTVENMPEVIEVQTGAAPVKEPFQYSSHDSWDNTHPGSITVLGTGEHSDVVPEGKRLVVEYISYSMKSDGILDDPMCEARVMDDTNLVVSHPLVLTESMYRDSVLFRVSTPITLYADSGTDVGVSCWVRVTEDVSETFGVTGYLVDIE